MKKEIAISLDGLLALLVVPVVIKQLSQPERRSLTSVKLEETQYQEVVFRNDLEDLKLAGMLFIASVG